MEHYDRERRRPGEVLGRTYRGNRAANSGAYVSTSFDARTSILAKKYGEGHPNPPSRERRLDPLTTSIYPEKRDYLSLRNKINSIIRRVEDSRLTLPDTRCTREERRGFLLAGFCVPRRPSLAKAKKSGKKRKASNEGNDDSYARRRRQEEKCRAFAGGI